MLRVLIISLFLYGCSSHIKTFEYVAYDQSFIPSCAIKITGEYWKWRYIQGSSGDIKGDVSHFYGLYLHLVKLSEGNVELSNERVMCNSLILMSPELARMMNYFGKNVSPMRFYYDFISQITDSNLDARVLTEHEVENLVVSVIQEVESRFLDDHTGEID